MTNLPELDYTKPVMVTYRGSTFMCKKYGYAFTIHEEGSDVIGEVFCECKDAEVVRPITDED